MNRLAGLLLKDVCLMRYKLCYVVVIPILLTLLVAFYNPIMLGLPCITIILLCIVPMSLQSLLVIESRDRKAKNYILSLPYSRKTIVAARYLYLAAEGILCIGLYLLVLLITGNWAVLSFSGVILSIVITGLMISVIMPLSYAMKGDLLPKLLFFIPICLSFVVSGITEHVSLVLDTFTAELNIPIVIICAFAFFLTTYVSAKISEKLLYVHE